MTQPKKSRADKTTVNLNRKFMELEPREQQGVTNFFNAHNIAHFIYDGLSEKAQQYVTYCIRLSQQADKVEQENSAHV